MKTLLILVDGMRPDSLKGIPSAEKFISESTGSLKARTVWPSATLPCHMSLFLSVPPERHGTTTNTYSPQVRPVDGICEVLKGHCIKSNGGLYYTDYFEFEGVIDYIFSHDREYTIMRENALRYVEENYRWDVIMKGFDEIIDYI